MPWRRGNKLALVAEGQAQGRVKEIYTEIKESLGTPHISIVFQAYAAYPAFLELHWQSLRPVVQTSEFFSLADRLRADAYTRLHSYFQVPNLYQRMQSINFSEGAVKDLTGTIDLFYYCEPLTLLMVAAQFQAFEAPIGAQARSTRTATPAFPFSCPVFVDESTAAPATRKTYDEIRRTLELSTIPSAFKAFARWPDFMREYWEALRIVLQSPVYEGCHYGVRETAFALTREFPVIVDLSFGRMAEAGLADEVVGSLVRINEAFVNALSGLVLEVAFAKIAIEGGTSRELAKPQTKRETPEESPVADKERAA